jgi:hypothetical protein
MATGILFCSAALLLYTAVIVPVQICLWTYDDPCNAFPTLYFDVIVDTFFVVPRPPYFSFPSHTDRELLQLSIWPPSTPPSTIQKCFPTADLSASQSWPKSTHATAQLEALLQFLLGRFRVDMSYDDSLLSVIAHNLASPTAFWFGDGGEWGFIADQRNEWLRQP